MIEALSAPQVRVVGCLVEKALTTPDYYPLTLNALKAACNQKSNRNPVVAYDEKTVVRALEGLRQHSLAARIVSDDARVPKYRHNLPGAFNLNPPQVAALCVLMLRGPQTAGEIRGRTGRMYAFESVDEAQATLQELIDRKEEPLVVQLPRQVGFKESRYAHLLAGEPELEAVPSASANVPLEAATLEVEAEQQRLAELEEQVNGLDRKLDELRAEFLTFKEQFE